MPRQPPTELKCDKATNRAFVRWQGKKHYFGQAGSQEASKAFGKWLADLHPEPTSPAPNSRLTVLQCVEQYLYHAEKYYSELIGADELQAAGIVVADGEDPPRKTTGEFTNVKCSMWVLLEHAGGPKDYVDKFGPRKLTKIQEAMTAEKVAKKASETGSRLKYCRNTINASIHRIRRCFRWCATQEMISPTIVTALDMVPGLPMGRSNARETKPVEPVPIAAVIATLPHLSPTVSAMVRIQLLCGMRPQDVCGMTGGELEMKDDIWLYRPADHKNAYRGQSLVKAISSDAQEILKPFLRDGLSEPLFATFDSNEYWRSLERRGPSKAKTPPKRECYTTSGYGRSIVYAIARAKKTGVTIPHWSPNQLRHAIATYLREEGSAEDAQLLLGHADLDTTLIYAKRSEKRLKQIARKLVSPLGKE